MRKIKILTLFCLAYSGLGCIAAKNVVFLKPFSLSSKIIIKDYPQFRDTSGYKPGEVYSFGSRVAGSNLKKVFYLKNTDQAPILIGTMSVSDKVGNIFKLESTDCPERIESGQICRIIVSFTAPATLQGYVGDLTVYLSDNSGVRIDLTGQTSSPTNFFGIKVLAGVYGQTGTTNGNSEMAKFNGVHGMTQVGSALYVSDRYNGRIRKIENGNVETFLNLGANHSPNGLVAAGNYLYTTDMGQVIEQDMLGHLVAQPVDDSKQRVIRINLQTKAIEEIISNSPGNLRVDIPTGLSLDGKSIYLADSRNKKIKIIDTDTLDYFDLPMPIDLNGPISLAPTGSGVYVSVFFDQSIRYVDFLNGYTSSNVTPNGSFALTGGLAFDGTNIFVTDHESHKLFKVSLSGSVTLMGGTGDPQDEDSVLSTAKINEPNSLLLFNGGMYISNRWSIRAIY